MELFKLIGTIALDGLNKFNSDIDGATSKASGLGSALANGAKTVASTAGKVVATVGKATIATVGAATTAVTVLGETALENYADYEQLVGGAELMFGEGFSFIAEQAANAYKTVQMSQNDYLRQVNGFAVGLKTSLGGNEKAAAELAHKIIKAEADIIAATGNSQEAVQNAFNGIMKSNFTMLDNLGLGITPTKEGFQEMIDKVNEWNEANGEATEYQIDNLADCQSALVDYIKMQGMSGYAAEEASKTITGSLASAKAAWQNLITGFGDENADLSSLFDNLVESAETALKNIAPRIEIIFESLGELITSKMPDLLDSAFGLVSEYAPKLFEAGADLAGQLVEGIGQNLGNISPVLEPVGQMILDIKESLTRTLDTLKQNINWESVFSGLQSALEVVCGLITDVVEGFEDLVSYATTEGTPLNDFFSNLQGAAQDVVDWFAENWSDIEKSCNNVKEGVKTALEGLITALSDTVAELDKDDSLQKLLEPVKKAIEDIGAVAQPAGESVGILAGALKDIVIAFGDLTGWIGKQTDSPFKKIGEWIGDANIVGWQNFRDILQGIRDMFNGEMNSAMGNFASVASRTVDDLKKKWEDFLGFLESVADKISSFFSSVGEGIADVFGSHKEEPFSTKTTGGGGQTSGSGAGRRTESGKPNISDKGNNKSNGTEFYASGGILTKPTAFAYNPYTEKTMIGGEDGAEAIAPISLLQNYVTEATRIHDGEQRSFFRKITSESAKINGGYLFQMADSIIEKIVSTSESRRGSIDGAVGRVLSGLYTFAVNISDKMVSGVRTVASSVSGAITTGVANIGDAVTKANYSMVEQLAGRTTDRITQIQSEYDRVEQLAGRITDNAITNVSSSIVSGIGSELANITPESTTKSEIDTDRAVTAMESLKTSIENIERQNAETNNAMMQTLEVMQSSVENITIKMNGRELGRAVSEVTRGL